jgi:putative transcriptional regulator
MRGRSAGRDFFLPRAGKDMMRHMEDTRRRGHMARIERTSWMATIFIASAMIVSSMKGMAQAQEIGAKPFFLVARADMPDPTFRQAVILMLPSSSDQAPVVAGVIINQPMRVTLDELFQHMPSLKHPEEHAYFGGPVDYSLPLLITRGAKPSVHAIRLVDNLYVSGGVEASAEVVSRPWSPRDVRLFLGRAQWAPAQLRGEILHGAWDALPVNADLIFSRDPRSVWRGLQKQSHFKEVGWPLAPVGDLRLTPALD